MPLFYPKWTGIDGDTKMNFTPKSGAKKKAILFPKPKDPNIDASGLMTDTPEIPLLQNEIQNEEPVAGLFRGNESSFPLKEMPTDKVNPRPKLFGSRREEQQLDEFGLPIPQKRKIGGFQEFLSNFIPGVRGRYGANEEYNDAVSNYIKLRSLYAPEKTGSQKDFEYYSKLDPESQKKYLEMKAAGSVINQPFQQRKYEEEGARKKRDDEMAFRKEYSGSPLVKEFNEANLGINKIREAINSPDKTGFNDQALIFNFMKVLDPGSVVREGEYASAAKNASLFDRFGIKIDRVLSGEQLSPDQRQNLLKAAELQFKASQDRYGVHRKDMERIAKESGLDPSKVLPNFEGTSDPYAEHKKWIKENPNDPRAAAAVQKLIQLGAM